MALIDGVRMTCEALAPAGWRELLLGLTDGGFDLLADDLAAELVKPLATIDRTVSGFEDFTTAGDQAITSGIPAQSLLYHALASPLVQQISV